MKRRDFLKTSALAVPALSALSASTGRAAPTTTEYIEATEPVLRRELLPDPVIIESITLVTIEKNWFVRARSTDGVEGWAISHNTQIPLCYPVVTRELAPWMKGKDARDLDHLVDGVFLEGSHYKMQGQLFWIPVASVEFAILDLLGRTVGKSAAELLGGRLREEIPLYIANNHRSLGPEESLKKIVASVDKIGAKAVKFKLGGRMRVIDQVPGRTEALIPMVAEALGDRCTLYADANSSYTSVDQAIHIGRLLEKHGFGFYEEPCPFDWLEETRRVADALDIPIAWGECESSAWRFRWMIENGGAQIVQPDLFYYGGLIRSLRVARMAAARGLDCTPHISGTGLGFLYMGIYATCSPDPGAHQEYKGINRNFPWESPEVEMVVRDGVMPAPRGPGLGINIDPEYLARARVVTA